MTPEETDLLTDGALEIIGRVAVASNTTVVCAIDRGTSDEPLRCVYKPVRGERPLWDFPDGTLAGREVASYLISDALGWGVIPTTVLRDGPLGPGMVQRWIDSVERHPEEGTALDMVDLCRPDLLPTGWLPVLRAYDERGDEVTLVHADDPRLMRMAILDVIINNADRKGGHVLEGLDGSVYGVDHGICLHEQDKLRTVLWGWAGRAIDDGAVADIVMLGERLGGSLAGKLEGLITVAEIDALAARIEALVARPVMPTPDRGRPVPWPAF